MLCIYGLVEFEIHLYPPHAITLPGPRQCGWMGGCGWVSACVRACVRGVARIGIVVDRLRSYSSSQPFVTVYTCKWKHGANRAIGVRTLRGNRVA